MLIRGFRITNSNRVNFTLTRGLIPIGIQAGKDRNNPTLNHQPLNSPNT